MRRFLHPSLTLLVALLYSSILSSVFVNANDENDRPTPAPVIPNQYIVYYKKNTDRVATNKRLFYSPTSSIASSNAFSVVHQMKKAVAVKGINEEQYQQLLQDPSVDRIIPVRTHVCLVTTVFPLQKKALIVLFSVSFTLPFPGL